MSDDDFLLVDGSQFILLPSDAIQGEGESELPGLKLDGELKYSFPPLPYPDTQTEKIFLAKLELKSKKEPFSPITIWVSNKNYDVNDLWSGSPFVYPGLIDLSGFSQRMGELIPSASSGSVTLNNTRGTLSNDRRFSDLIQDYAFYFQYISIYSFIKPVTSAGSESNLVSEFRGLIGSIKATPDNNLEIEVESEDLGRESPNYIIELEQLPAAPPGLVGEALPIVFGEDVEVQAIKLEAKGLNNTTAKYAYASTFGSTFVNGGVQELYIKDYDNEYRKFTPTAVILDYPIQPGGGSDLGTYIGEWEVEAVAYRLQAGVNCQAGHTIAGFDWFLAPSSPGVTNGRGQYTITVYSEENGLPAKEIRKCHCPIDSDQRQLISGSVYVFQFWLDQVCIVPENGSLFFALSRTDPDDIYSPLVWDGNVVTGTPPFTKYIKEEVADIADVAANNWFIEYANATAGKHSLTVYGVNMVDQPTPDSSRINTKGLGRSQFYLQRRDQRAPDLANLDIVAKVDGLKDNSSGTITGSANSLITSPVDAIRLMYYMQNNNSLSGLSYYENETAVRNALFDHRVSGASEGKKSYKDLLQDLLSSFCCKLYPGLSGDMILWAYGNGISPVVELSESECTILSQEILGRGSIVNSLNINYDKRAIPLSVQEAQRNNDNFFKTRTYEETSSLYPSGRVAFGSIGLYGREEIGSTFNNMIWFKADKTADRLARYVLSTYGEELLVLAISCPANRESYNQILKTGSIIALNHIDLPCNTGSGSEVVEKLPSYDLEECANFVEGYPFRRSSRLLFRITGRSADYRILEDEPSLTLLLRQVSDREAKRPEIF